MSLDEEVKPLAVFNKGGKGSKEVKKWEKEIKKGKGGWDPYFSLVRFYHHSGEKERLGALLAKAPSPLREALEAYRLCLEGEGGEARDLLGDLSAARKEEQAWLAFLKGLLGDSRGYQECLTLYPRHPWSREIKLLMGEAFLQEGRGEEALGHLMSLEREKDPRVYLLVGKIYHQMGNLLAARNYLDRVLSGGKGDERREAAALVSRLARQKEEWDKVASALRILAQGASEGEMPRLQKELAEAYIKGGRTREARRVLEELGEAPDLWATLARVLEGSKDWKGALEAWERVGGDQGALGKGRVLLASGKVSEARETLKRALEGENRQEALFLLAQGAWQEGDAQEALRLLEEMGEEALKGSPEAAHLLARAALEVGDGEKAVQWALEAYQALPEGDRRQVKPTLKKIKKVLEGAPTAKKWLPLLEEALKESPLFQRLKEGLFKSRQGIARRLEESLGLRGEVTQEDLERIEEVLISADVGVETTRHLVKALEKRMARGEVRGKEGVMEALKDEILRILQKAQGRLEVGPPPWVVMVVGVNGTGKTTTIAKLARRITNQGKKVLLVAGDTFRAAAIEQLEIWADRVGVPLVKHQPGAHPSGVVYDALQAAKARGSDVVIIDTAGRLHTKVNLMEELKKMARVAAKEVPGAPQETLLVLDATTGQNALSQARLFSQAVPITGLVLTKLDGTAKGGIIIAIAGELSIPIKLIGVGEGMDDLQDFHAEAFVEALFEVD